MIELKSKKEFNLKIITLGYSKRGLARASGVSEATIIKISNGRQSPRPETAKKICKVLGVEFSEIFKVSDRTVQ